MIKYKHRYLFLIWLSVSHTVFAKHITIFYMTLCQSKIKLTNKYITKYITDH